MYKSLLLAVVLFMLGQGVSAQDLIMGGYRPEATHVATILTSLGTITVNLYGKDAPRTVNNFVGLCQLGYYKGVRIHRIVPGFLFQAGDPFTKDTSQRDKWGSGGVSLYGVEFEDELDFYAPSYKRGYIKGTLAMANKGPNTNTSQFFVCLKDLNNLPKQYTIFGFVVDGIEIVDKIAGMPCHNALPNVNVDIYSITIERIR